MKKLLCFGFCVTMLLSVPTGCTWIGAPDATNTPKTTQSPIAGGGDNVVLRLAENQPADYPTTLGDQEFARLVNERTDGRIKIEVYYGGQLGDEKSVLEQVQIGAIDFARVSLSPISEFSKNLNALQFPYIYRDEEHMWKVLDGPIGDELLESVKSANLVGLTWYDSGSRHFYNTKKEIKKVSDLKGLKIRVQESQLMMGMITALGASPTPMPYGDVYSALQTGVIDGAENNWPSYISSSHYEVAKYITLDSHTRVPEIVVASLASMNKLSQEDQDIIRQAAKDSTKVQKKEWAEYSAKSEQAAKDAGAVITELDEAALKEFQDAMKPLYDEQGKDYADLIKRIQDTK